MLGVILQIWITKNWVITFVIIENMRGFTQEKLAELSNISEKHLSKIERGKINIKIDTLVNIAACIKCFC